MVAFWTCACGGEEGGDTDTGAPGEQELVDLDELSCSSGQSGGGLDEPCYVDFECGYRIDCDAAVGETRGCRCVVGGEVIAEVEAPHPVCGSAAIDEIRRLGDTKELSPSLTSTTEACGWSYRCCACRERQGHPLFGVNPCR